MVVVSGRSSDKINVVPANAGTHNPRAIFEARALMHPGSPRPVVSVLGRANATMPAHRPASLVRHDSGSECRPAFRWVLCRASPGIRCAAARLIWPTSRLASPSIPSGAGRASAAARAKTKFARAIKLIWAVQMRSEKYSTLHFQKSMVSSPHPASLTRGASRTSRCVGVGCGGRDGAQHALGMPTYATSRTVKSQGPGLPTLRSAQRVKRVVATVANKPVTEETAYKS